MSITICYKGTYSAICIKTMYEICEYGKGEDGICQIDIAVLRQIKGFSFSLKPVFHDILSFSKKTGVPFRLWQTDGLTGIPSS